MAIAKKTGNSWPSETNQKAANAFRGLVPACADRQTRFMEYGEILEDIDWYSFSRDTGVKRRRISFKFRSPASLPDCHGCFAVFQIDRTLIPGNSLRTPLLFYAYDLCIPGQKALHSACKTHFLIFQIKHYNAKNGHVGVMSASSVILQLQAARILA